MQLDRMFKENTTGLVVAGLGLLVTGIGKMLGGRLGDTLSGFGMAHILLGILDSIRN